jgi:transcription elongation factor Elf1
MSKSINVERAELYKDHLVQVFLSKFLIGEITKLTPTFSSDHGYKYPIVEAILGGAEEAEKFLDTLSKTGILERELYDKILRCPNCTSPDISTHYNCPHCGSFNVKKSSLIEHLKCGYIDTEDHFREKNKLVCPRCKKELVDPDVDYRKAGIWCNCNSCGKSFDIAVTSHFCRRCNKNFTFEDAIYENVFSYQLSDEARQEASLGWILVTPIREFLKDRNFEVETPGFLKGKSGASHMFDIVAFKEKTRSITVIDLATSDSAISEQPIIAMFAKIYDVSPEKACLIAIPKISENGKKMAKLYNISLIEATNSKDAVNKLEEVFTRQ